MRITTPLFTMVVLGWSVLPALAQNTTTITITNAACTNPAPPAEVAPPVTPNVAAGTAAARSRNFALARANFLPPAEKGDVEAERSMGQLLMQNCTGLQDKPAAVDWLTKAVDSGDVAAQAQLGRAYMLGSGVPQDDGRAFALYTKAATAGNAVAEMELGYFYSSGRGVASDLYQGMVWTVKAGEQGNPVALGNIARGYFRGETLPQDNDRAAFFLAVASQRATLGERSEFSGIAENIRRQISQDDMVRAAKRAQHWAPGAGSLSDVLADAARRRDRHG